MKNLVTGGAGFIGSHLCEKLLDYGEVICVDNLAALNNRKKPLVNIEKFQGRKGFKGLFKDVLDLTPEDFEGVDYVFHNAASKCTVCREDPRRDFEVNAWGAFNVFDCARKAGVKKVIHASTGSTMDGRPKSNYGASKLAGEAYAGVFSNYYPEFRHTVLRYYHVYGPRQESSWFGGVIPIFIWRVYANCPITIYGSGEQVRHFTAVKDVVRANLFMTSHGDGEDYAIPSDTTITITQLAHKIGKMMDKKIYIQYEPERAGDIKTFNVTNEKIKRLGFEFKEKFDDYLRTTINWYMKKWKSSGS